MRRLNEARVLAEVDDAPAGPMALPPTPQAPPNKHRASGDGDSEPAKKKPKKGKSKGKSHAARRSTQQQGR